MGLVLAGGQSRRMGMDKGKLLYHDKPQREYLYDQMEPLCTRVFLSIRPEQQEDIPPGLNFILDENQYKGPFNGLLSAHHAFPEAAWLVVACDLPLVNQKVLKYLVDRRDRRALATAFATHKSKLPEPLAAIWEPHGLKTAESYMQSAKSSCPRKFLINEDTFLVFPEDDLWLANANEPEEYEQILSQLNSK
ncbi:MAG: molybdenum cofactor guanylyltransferase [Robiginitalea sp.]